MRIRGWTALAVVMTLGAGAARGRVVSTYNELAGQTPMTTVTFNEHSSDNGASLAALGQPYLEQGLMLPSQAVVGDADLGGFSRGAAVRSTAVSPIGNMTVQSINFDAGQRRVGMWVRDRLAAKVTLSAYDAGGKLLESATVGGGGEARYVGFVREKAEIAEVRIEAGHGSPAAAMESPTMVDDISFEGLRDSNGAMGGGGAGVRLETGGATPRAGGPSESMLAGAGGETVAAAAARRSESRSAALDAGSADEGEITPQAADERAAALVKVLDGTGPAAPVSVNATPVGTARVVSVGSAPPAEVHAVPEPTAVAIGAMVLGPLMLLRRRQRRGGPVVVDRRAGREGLLGEGTD